MNKISDSVNRKFVDSISIDDWQIESTSGWVDVSAINKTIQYEVYRLTTTNCFVQCADEHIVFLASGEEVFVKDLNPGDAIIGQNGAEYVISVERTGTFDHMYDLTVCGDHTFYAEGILHHNTTTVAAYLVWYIIFNNDKTVAILANKASAAREVMSRLQLMYENLPKWLQHGIKEWNKGSIKLANNSNAFTAATSSSGIRGKSCVTADTKVCVELDGNITTTEISNLLDIDAFRMKILSSDGFKTFGGFIDQGISSSLYELAFDDTSILKATFDHRLLRDDQWVEVEKLKVGDVVSDKKIKSIRLISNQRVYDALEVSDVNNYYTNSVLSHNCNYLYIDECAIIPNNVADDFFTATYPTISSGETTKIALTTTPLGMNFFYKFWTEAEQGINGFVPIRVHYNEHPNRDEKWAKEQLQLLGETKFNQETLCQFLGSSDSLLSGEALGKLASKQPTHLLPNNTLRQYYEPVKNHSYVMLVDTARGKGLDYSAFHVIDISTLPYQIACSYRDNNISTLVFPEVIYRIGEMYNNAFVLIETNDLGQQVADILFYDLEYENVYMSSQDNIKEGGDSKYSPGLRTTKKTKAVGCDMLKNLIENDKLEVNDAETISEFTTFIRVGSTYKAEEGKHDDLVMCLVMFAYLTTQPVFKDLFDFSLREQFFASQLLEIENQMLPLGFVDRGEPAVEVGQYTGNGWVVGNDDDFNW